MYGVKDPFAEKSANLDSNDSRMQQVMWVNGSLWGALDTALAVSSAKQAGIEWIASEYIGQSCDFSTYKNSAFRCGNSRTALANWGTRISLVAAP